MIKSKWFKAMNIAAGSDKINTDNKPWFRFVNVDNGEKAEIYIYGYIVDQKWDPSDPDVTPIEFRDELAKFPNAKNIDIYMLSGGGNVFAGMAIYHMLKRHPANITVYNDGIIASISSVISMAADKIIMPRTSMTLIHKPLLAGLFVANADDLLELAAELDKVEFSIIEAYKQKTGLSDTKIKEIMRKDEYMNAEEAIELGLADVFDDSKDIKASIEDNNVVINGISIDISNFKDFPKNQFKTAEKPLEKPDFSLFEAQIAHNQNFI